MPKDGFTTTIIRRAQHDKSVILLSSVAWLFATIVTAACIVIVPYRYAAAFDNVHVKFFLILFAACLLACAIAFIYIRNVIRSPLVLFGKLAGSAVPLTLVSMTTYLYNFPMPKGLRPLDGGGFEIIDGDPLISGTRLVGFLVAVALIFVAYVAAYVFKEAMD